MYLKTNLTVLKKSIILLLLSPVVQAADLKGEGQASITSLNGNTNSNNINLSLELEKYLGKWVHTLELQALKNSSNGNVDAESYLFSEKSDFFYKHQTYGFIALRYEEDRFSSFSYQTSLSFGIGTRVIETDREDLDLSFGLGMKRLKEQTIRDTNTEAILRFSGDYLYQVSDSSQFTENLLVEHGSSNTQLSANTSLETFISEQLSTKFSYLIKYNTTTPAETKHIDSQTSIAIVYRF